MDLRVYRCLFALILLKAHHAKGDWWSKPWREQWVNVSLAGQTYHVQTRRVGDGPTKLFCVQGGPGGLFWDLDFLAVYLDLARFEVIQYNPLGSLPSSCSNPQEPCSSDTSWMTVNGFVSIMDQVHRILHVPSDAIIVGHSFGVVCALEFLIQWPARAAGAVLSDWVASQAQAARRDAWCDGNGWDLCRMYNASLEEPWRKVGLTNDVLGQTVWGPSGNGTGGSLENWDVRQHLPSLRGVPTLSFAGEFDIVFPFDVEAMAEELHGEYVYLRGAGHFSFVDCREQWLEAFNGFIRRLPLERTKSEGCTMRAEPQPRDAYDTQSLGHRRYFLHMPASYRSALPHSLVISFHGLAAQPEDAVFFDHKPSSPSNVIIAFPEGLDDSGSMGSRRSFNGSGSVGSPGPAGPTCKQKLVQPHPCCETCEAQGGCYDECWLTTCADDVAFAASVLDDVERKFCIDTASIHAVGFSNGAWLALELATDSRTAHRFASIATVAGVPFRGYNRPPLLRADARLLGIYGRADTLVPAFSNRPDGAQDEALASTGWIFSTWENTTKVWAQALGCSQALEPSMLRPAADGVPMHCLDYSSCPREARVSACLWDGPHAVPAGTEDLVWQSLFPAHVSSYIKPLSFPSTSEAGDVVSGDAGAPYFVLAVLLGSMALSVWSQYRHTAPSVQNAQGHVQGHAQDERGSPALGVLAPLLSSPAVGRRIA